MQAAFEITVRYCSKELEAYGECVTSNPSSWQKDCYQLKTMVAQCTSSHPVIQKIRAECAEPFLAFEQCLKQNQSTVTNCTEHVNEFLACAEKVKVPRSGANVPCCPVISRDTDTYSTDWAGLHKDPDHQLVFTQSEPRNMRNWNRVRVIVSVRLCSKVCEGSTDLDSSPPSSRTCLRWQMCDLEWPKDQLSTL